MVVCKAAWNDDVEHLLKEIDINPYMLHAMALEGGETPLHIACLAGHLNFVVTVIKLRQEFSWELNQDGFSPLHIAAASGHVEIVKELLKVDLGLCLIKGKDRRIPLHLAVVKGKVNVIKNLILSSLESVECTTAQGENGLHLAVTNNQFEAFQVLVQHLKHVNKEHLLNSKDFDENTILHLAVARKQYEVVDFLLNGHVTSKEMIGLNTVNKSGMTPLDLLLTFQSESSDDRKIEKILTEAGALKAENLQSPVYIEEERPHHHDTIHENPLTPTRKLIDYFKYNNLNDSPSKVRNNLLVIVILITAATYQPSLSPPGGTWQDDSTTNNSTINNPRIAGEAIMGTNNPIAYSIFVVANSMGFYMSLHMISVLTTAFPLRMELRISIIALAVTYGDCMIAIAPSNFTMFVFIGISTVLPFLIPYTTTLLRNYLKKPRYASPQTSQVRV
uniref:ankyrin repeat-containing protein BDA1-like n=1 Tax=Erigeron canadensis TaxID=72917 RepID=UPI001CB9006B|nr:ankyrin repeat-containing protein BDA1-like [Erigeron canadensis]